MKNKHNKKAVPTIDDNEDLSEDRNILEALYEIGEKVATYDSIFTLIYEFEKINKIKPKSRRKYILGQNKNNKTTL